MRKNLSFLLILFTTIISSQNIVINKNNGSKIIADDKSFDYVKPKGKVSYKEQGKSWYKRIDFDEINDINIGENIYMQSLKLINKKGKEKKSNLFFVLSENANYKLILFSFTVCGNYACINNYNLYVVDKRNKIIDELKFKYTKTAYEETRSKVKPMILKYFSDCNTLVNRLNSIEDDTKNYLNICDQFLDKPFYYKCN